jgi:hypothetical protein
MGRTNVSQCASAPMHLGLLETARRRRSRDLVSMRLSANAPRTLWLRQKRDMEKDSMRLSANAPRTHVFCSSSIPSGWTQCASAPMHLGLSRWILRCPYGTSPAA